MAEIPPPPQDTLTLLIEVDKDNIHFVDNIFKSHDNIAQVRRDYRVFQGRPCYEILVPPQLLEETYSVIERLKDLIPIGIVKLLAETQESE